MFPVLLPEQFHFPTQAGGGGPGAKWPAERISVWHSRAPQRKPGRRSRHAEAEEAGGDDKDRARRYDSLLCACVWGMDVRIPFPPKYTWSSQIFLLFLHNFLVSKVVFSPISLHRHVSWEYWRYSVSSLFWTSANVTDCVAVHLSISVVFSHAKANSFNYKTHSTDLMPGTLPLFILLHRTLFTLHSYSSKLLINNLSLSQILPVSCA